VSVLDATRLLAALGLAALLSATVGAQSPLITDADIEQARRRAPRVTDEDVEAARRLHRMPSEAELSRVPIPSAPKIDALPQPAVQPRVDLEAIARGYRSIEASAAGLTSSEPTMLVFISFSMPEATLRRLVSQATSAQASLVIRGLVNNSLKETVAKAQRLIGERKVSFQIDPLAFDRFGVTKAPSFVLLRRGAEARSCDAGSCFAADAYVMASGDVSIRYALEFLSRSAPAFAAEADPFLRRLKG
jgi:conjugal transfer pilus assembly protein TrbC